MSHQEETSDRLSRPQSPQWNTDREAAEKGSQPLIRSDAAAPKTQQMNPAMSRDRDQCGRCRNRCLDRGFDGGSKCLPMGVIAVAAIVAVLFLTRSDSSLTSSLRSADNVGAGIVADSEGKSRRSFVCITGQLERLELENKVGTVLSPLREAGYEPDIALVLDDATLHVTNTQKVDFDYAQSPAFKSFHEAAEHLRGYDFNVVTDLPYSQVPEPILNEDYVNHLQKRSKMSMEEHRERSKNNIRMLESWSQCFQEMTQDFERAATYEVVVRIREDVGFIEALDIEDYVKDLALAPKTVLSNGCRQNRGMNDKYAIMSRDAAQSYFEDPFRYYYSKPIHEKVMSSETFIFYTYLAEGLKILKGPKIRHIVKLVSDESGRTLLFPKEKRKLIKACNIEIEDETAFNACTSSWDADTQQLETQNKVCWPYKYILNTTNHCK